MFTCFKVGRRLDSKLMTSVKSSRIPIKLFKRQTNIPKGRISQGPNQCSIYRGDFGKRCDHLAILFLKERLGIEMYGYTTTVILIVIMSCPTRSSNATGPLKVSHTFVG